MKIVKRINGQKIDLVLDKTTKGDPAKNWVPACFYNIVLHGTNQVVGVIDARIGSNENLYYGGHIGYTVNEEFRGHGYAVEAVELVKQVFILNEMHKVYITNNLDNKASIRVCEKAGAKFIAVEELPSHNDMRVKRGETHKNIWELSFGE